MFKILQHLGLILIFGCFVCTEVESTKPCDTPLKPTCKCSFDGKEIPIETNTSGNEALVGAVSAMGSLLLTGSGIGIYMLLKDRCSTPQRPDSLVKKKPGPRSYGNVPSSNAPTNVYRSGMSDEVNPRTTNRMSSANSYGRGTLSDWT